MKSSDDPKKLKKRIIYLEKLLERQERLVAVLLKLPILKKTKLRKDEKLVRKESKSVAKKVSSRERKELNSKKNDRTNTSPRGNKANSESAASDTTNLVQLDKKN